MLLMTSEDNNPILTKQDYLQLFGYAQRHGSNNSSIDAIIAGKRLDPEKQVENFFTL